MQTSLHKVGTNNMESNKICKLRNVYRAIAELENEFEKAFGLNINETMFLCTLNENERMTAGEIAETLGLSCSNTSKVIGSVEKHSLVKRRLGKENRRQMYLSLTEKGSNLLDKIKCDSFELPPLLRKITEY